LLIDVPLHRKPVHTAAPRNEYIPGSDGSMDM